MALFNRDKSKDCGYSNGRKCGWRCEKHKPEAPPPAAGSDKQITVEEILLGVEHDITMARQGTHITLLTRALAYCITDLLKLDYVVIPAAKLHNNQGINVDVDELSDGFHIRVSKAFSIPEMEEMISLTEEKDSTETS